MNYCRVFFSCWLMFMFSLPAAAYDFQQGMHGMEWGSSVAQYDDLTKVHETNTAAYYAKSNTLYQLSSQPIPGVFYGFYRDRFFAVFVKLQSPQQFTEIKKSFNLKYGHPKSTFYPESKQRVYRWNDGDVKIKLKMKEDIWQYKMVFYYKPLSVKLNEEQLESLPPNTPIPNSSQEGETVKTAPLLGQ
jgi:hypothetical protein